jgi:predicted phosphodiesterase
MSKKIVVLSDIHAEIPVGWKDKLEKLRINWQGADMAIFNGDTINWTSNHELEQTAEIVEYIKHICAEDGVEPLILAGNADYLISDNHFFFHEPSKTLVFHGEVVYPEFSPWRIEHKLLEKRYNCFMENAVNGDVDINVRFDAAKHVINIYEFDQKYMNNYYYRLPWVINPLSWLTLVHVWNNFPNRVAKFARQYYPEAQRVVVGHFHRAGAWNIDGLEIICTGAFRRFATPLIVSLEGNKVSYAKAKKNRT